MLDQNTPCPREYCYYRTPHNPAVRSHGGCLLYVRHDIPQISVDLQTDLQAVAVKIDIGRTYTICSIYLPPNDDVSNEDLVDLIHQLPQPFLLLGDTNSRHPLWGDVLANTKGNLIASILEN